MSKASELTQLLRQSMLSESNKDSVDWKKLYKEGEDHWTDDLEPSKFAQQMAKELVDQGKESVLEIGCGNGRDSILFALSGLNVTSIDLVQDAIDMAKTNAEKMNADIDFQTGNAEKLTFEDESFDAVFTLSVLHATNISKSIKEINRVLKEDGIAFIYIYSNVEKEDGTKTEFVSVDEFITLLKEEGFKISDIYTKPEEEFDEAGEKHLIIVAKVSK